MIQLVWDVLVVRFHVGGGWRYNSSTLHLPGQSHVFFPQTSTPLFCLLSSTSFCLASTLTSYFSGRRSCRSLAEAWSWNKISMDCEIVGSMSKTIQGFWCIFFSKFWHLAFHWTMPPVHGSGFSYLRANQSGSVKIWVFLFSLPCYSSFSLGLCMFKCLKVTI